MDIRQLLVQVVIAIVCAGAANLLVPRKIPGKLIGLILIGLAGVWIGEWAIKTVVDAYPVLRFPFWQWSIEDVLIIPAIIGCAIVLYVVTAVLKWWRRGG